MRNRIRSGLPLSHQVMLHDSEQERALDVDINSENSDGVQLTRENKESPDERSENVLSSGMDN